MLASAAGVDAEEIRFSTDIQPLLAKRCFACHGPAEQEAGVALHQRDIALVRADSGRTPIVPHKPGASELIRRVSSTDAAERMPPEGPPLSTAEVDRLRSWIAEGAVYEKHWAYVAPVRSELPIVQSTDQVRHAIDHFVLAKLEVHGFKLSPPAPPEKLLRRLFIDLTGLLPPSDQLNSLLNQLGEDDGYERVVDQLLASPHFGERWGRHWLDLARYADTFGYERDDVRPNAWRYRDWVVNSFNRNQPIDEFVIDQLAGDLLDEPTQEQQIAVGLHRMNIKNNESGINKEDYRNRETVDRVNTTATALLATTIGCAQCHTHKYDPISHAEYYQFYSFFNNVEERNVDIEGSPAERKRYEAANAAYEARKKRLAARKSLLDAMRKHDRAEDWLATIGSFDPKLLDDLDITDDVRRQIIQLARNATDSAADSAADSATDSATGKPLEGSREQAASSLITKFWSSLDARYDDTRKAERQQSVESRHLPKPYIMTLAEVQKDRRATHVLVRGDFKQKGDEVGPATPAILHPLRARSELPDRLDLARWLVSRENPLTARVAVNHIWRRLFGTGIVSTPDDFGTQGDPPSHPQLLDWLAVELMETGWDRKRMIKTIVMSAAYRQDSIRARSEPSDFNTGSPHSVHEVDPQNRLLSRQSRFRVEAEIVRDLFLDASGLLHPAIGGPTIHPELPSGVADLGYKYKTRWLTSNRPERYRRGLYIHFKRTNPYPSLIMFDGPESNVCLAARNRSNTPLQALTTLNDPVFVECARALGQRLAQLPGDDARRIQQAGRDCFCRSFTDAEVREITRLLQSERAYYESSFAAAQKLLGKAIDRSSDITLQTTNTSKANVIEAAAWTAVGRALLNLDEFITRE